MRVVAPTKTKLQIRWVSQIRRKDKEASMAVELMTNRSATRKRSVSKAVAARVQELLAGNYAFMDSPIFKHKNIERELFTFDEEPKLPLTSWYQPTREDLDNSHVKNPQLMNAAEERLMFLRFNFAKRKLTLLQKKAKNAELTPELAEKVLEWH